MFRHVSLSGQTLRDISEKHRETSNVSEFGRKHFASREANFVSATMFPRVGKHGNIWANMETFEETLRITNVSATMFPSLPWALEVKNITII
jgi:hypothetical protein